MLLLLLLYTILSSYLSYSFYPLRIDVLHKGYCLERFHPNPKPPQAPNLKKKAYPFLFLTTSYLCHTLGETKLPFRQIAETRWSHCPIVKKAFLLDSIAFL